MDSSSGDGSDSSTNAIAWSDDEFDIMAVAMVLVVVNSNIAITNLIGRAKANHEQMIKNDAIAHNQHYRNEPRRPKALYCQHEVLHCILRDFLGIPGDLPDGLESR